LLKGRPSNRAAFFVASHRPITHKIAMSNVIIAELSSDTYCTALGITVTAAAPVLALCHKLTESSTRQHAVPSGAIHW